MGIRILYDQEQGEAALYCSTAGWAFGPLFHDGSGADVEHDGRDRAEAFLRWLDNDRQPFGLPGTDLRKWVDADIDRAYSAWLGQEAAQWAAEAAAEAAKSAELDA